MEYAAETRFYGSFIVAERMIELKEAVQQTVVSSVFNNWAAAQSAKVMEEAAAVKSICLNEEAFWKKEAQLVEIFAPVVKLLRLTDSALPALSKVSCCDSQSEGSCHDDPTFAQPCPARVLSFWCRDYYCSLFKDNVDASSLTVRQKASVNRIMRERWDFLHNDLHGAAFCLDPEFWDLNLNSEVSTLQPHAPLD